MYRIHKIKRWLWLVAVLLLAVTPAGYSVNYTWTNTQSNATGFWTNGVLWGGTGLVYPGSNVSDAAYLTNQFSGTSTNIINSRLSSTISALAISNSQGEAWLIVTNGATAATVLTNTALSLGSGGRLEIDNGGVVTGMTTLSWLGTNGTILLNNGGKLFTTAAPTIGAGGGVTSLVTSVSGPGNGGIWNMNGAALTIGSGSANLLTISSGAILTNMGALTITGNQNSLIATNGSSVSGAGAISFSGNVGQFGNTINLGNGLWNLASSSLIIGGANNASNNTFIGGTITNVTGLWVGGSSGGLSTLGAIGNSLIVTNAGGGLFMSAAGGLGFGAAPANQQGGGVNTTVILSNSFLWGNAVDNIGAQTSTNNSVTLLANSAWNNGAQNLFLGGWGFNGASVGGISNSLTLNGGMATNFGVVSVGYLAGAAGNQLTINNGGVLSNFTGLTVGGAGGANGNSAIVTNGGQMFMTSGAIAVGSSSGGAAGGNNNTVVISNSMLNGTAISYLGTASTNNTLTLINSTWNLGSSLPGLTIGALAGFNNVLTLNSTVVSNIGVLNIANAVGASSNQVVLGAGSVLTNVTGLWVGGSSGGLSTLGAIGNSLIVTSAGSGLFMTAAGGMGFGAAADQQGGGVGNVVILSNSFLWGNATVNIGAQTSTNNSVTLLTNTTWNNNAQELTLGGWGFNGASVGGISNSLTLNGGMATNFGVVSVGYLAGAAGNQLTINNGGVLSNFTGLTVGGAGGANGNSAIVTNGGQMFMTSGAIAVGSSSGGAAGGNNNTVVISNSMLNGTAISYLGTASTNNTLTLINSTWNLGSSLPGLTIGALAGFNNVLTLNSTVVSNIGVLNIANAVGASSNQVVLGAGSVLTNVTGLWVGGSSGGLSTLGAIGNSLIVTSAGSGLFMTAAGGMGFGAAADQQGGGVGNVVILSNSFLWGNATVNIGAQTSTNNSVTLLTNTTWNNNAQELTLGGWGFNGAVVGGISNSLTLNGASATNFGQLYVGLLSGSAGNQLLVENGGVFSNFTGFTIGGASGADGNSIIVTNGGKLVMSSGAITVGSGGNNNTVILSNSVLNGTGAGLIGSGGTNNVLTLINTPWNLGATAPGLTIGTGAALSNVMTVSGGVVSNVGVLNIGVSATSISNQLVISNGGVVSNVTGLSIGFGSGAGYNSVVVTNGGGLFMSSGAINIGFSGGNNSLVLSNGLLSANSASTVGSGASNNTVALSGGWNEGNTALSIGTGVAASNIFNINNGGILSNVSLLVVGASAGSISNQLIVNNGGVITNINGLNVGSAAGANFNSLLVTNSGRLFMTSGAMTIGVGNNNTVILSNSQLTLSTALAFGNGGSTNTLTLLNGTVWNNANLGLTVGVGIGTDNVMNVGGIISNVGALTVGNLGTSFSNQLVVTTGGVLSNVTGLGVGSTAGGNYNSLIVTNGSLIMTSGAGRIAVGSSGSAGIGSGNNTVILSNSQLIAGFATVIGWGSSNNTLTLLDGTVWNGAAVQLTVGEFVAFSNSVFLVNTIATNFSGLFVGGNGGGSLSPNANYNSLIETNGGFLSMTTGEIGVGAGAGTQGGGNNTLILSNAVLNNTAADYVGVGSSNNTMILLANTILSNQAITVGSGFAVSNSFLANGALITNNAGITVGSGSGANYNSFVVTNGGKLFMTSGNLSVGATAGGSTGGNGNTLYLSNAVLTASAAANFGFNSSSNTATLVNSLWNNDALGIIVGEGGATGNVLTISGGIATNISAISVGYANTVGNTSVGNGMIITNGAQVFLNAGGIYIGGTANGTPEIVSSNYVIVAGLGTVVTNAGPINLSGQGGPSSNSTLTVSGGAKVYGSSVEFEQFNGAFSTVTVSDTGSLLRVTGALDVPDASIGIGNQVIVSNGGFVIAGTTVNIGSTNNSLVVTGGGSTLTNGGALNLNGELGSVLVSAGGALIDGSTTIGGAGSLSNSFTVTGPGSIWSNSATGVSIGGTHNNINITNASFYGGAVTFGNAASASSNAFNLINSTSSNGVFLIGSGSSFNTMTVSNTSIWSQGLTVGGTGSSNVLNVLGGSVWNLNNQTLVVGSATATSNSMVINNAILTNISSLAIGTTPGASSAAVGNQLIITNGGQVFNTGALSIGNTGNQGGSTAVSNSVIVTGIGSFLTNAAVIYVGGQGGPATFDSLTVAGGAQVFGSSLNFANFGGSFNLATVTDTGSVLQTSGSISSGGDIVGAVVGNQLVISNGGAVVINGVGGLIIGNASGIGISNSVIVTGGGSVLSNVAGAVNIGTVASSIDNQFIVSSGASVFNAALNVGTAAGANSNNFSVTSSTVSNSGLVTIGANGGNYNTMTASNATLWSAGLTIGNAANSNTVTVNAGSVWNLEGGNVIVGTGAVTGNVLTVNGGVLTNFGTIIIGNTAGSISNGLVLQNAVDLIGGAITIGNAVGASNNYLNVINSVFSNGLVTIGSTSSGFNSMTVSNSQVWSQGLTLGNGSSNNTLNIEGNVTWNLLQGALTLTSGTGTGNLFTVVSSSVLTNIGGISLGQAGTTLALTNNQYWLTTGGGLNVGTVAGKGNITLLVSNQTYTSGNATSTIGLGSSNNLLAIFGKTLWVDNDQAITVGSGASTGNVLTLNDSTLTSVSSLTVGAGGATGNSLLISNSTATLNSLFVNTGNTINFSGGTLTLGPTVISNGQNFVAGDGLQSATVRIVGGPEIFQNNFIITNNATLSGNGNIIVNNGAGKTVIASGGWLSPGNSPGVITNNGTLEWDGGGNYLWQINSLTGAAGSLTGWDFVQVNGTLNITANSGNKFNINVASLTISNTTGLLGGFNIDGVYNIAIATATGGITGFLSSDFNLNLASFQNPYDGLWVVQLSNNSVVVSYQGVTNFLWNSTSGDYSAAGQWEGNAAPPVGQTNVVLYFGGTGSQQYTATNDLTGMLVKRIILTNNSSAVQTSVGNSIGLVGFNPEIQQNGTGGFVIVNGLIMGTNTTFDGTGPGTLEVDGQISGAYNLTMAGNYGLVLGGSNTFTGLAIIQQGQVLLGNAQALASITVSNNVNGGLGFTNLTAATIGGLYGAGNIGLTNTAGAGVNLTVAGAGTYTGSLSGSGSLTKSAGGTQLSLNGINPYTGNTIINGGTLQVSGSIGSTNLTINNGGALNWSSVTALTNLSVVAINFGGVFNLMNDGTLAGLTGGGGILNLGGSTLQVGFGGFTTNYAGAIAGGGTISKVGSGTFTINGGGDDVVGSLAANGGWLVITNATVAATGAGGSSSVTVNNGGTFQIDNGTVITSNLLVSGGVVLFDSGTLAAANALVTNGAVFTVGNGLNQATYQLLGGTHSFANGLTINSNATLSGVGTVNGLVTINSGATESPGGSGVGTLSITGTNVWQGGGRYLFNVADFSVPNQQGVNWDLLAVTGILSNNAGSGSPFVIDVASAGVANFNRDNDYTMTIATASGGVVDFTTNNVSIITSNLAAAYDGTFSLSVQGDNLVLSYQGTTNFVWENVSGNFSGSNNWIVGNPPPTSTTNVVMYFGGTGAQQYTANNDLLNLFTKRIVLTNSSTAVQTLQGNAITLIGVAPEVQQNSAGGFVIANNLVLGTNSYFDGTGTGTVEVDGQISGAYSLSKTGAYALVLGGLNTFTGNTIIQQGQVVAANAGALANSVVNNLIDGGLGFSNLTAATIGGLAGTGSIGLSNTDGNAVGLTISGSGNNSYAGALTGSGSLTKSGSGTETLSGTNLYTGNTVVSGGALTVSGSIASTNVTVNSGGTLNWAATMALANTAIATLNGTGLLNFQTSGTLAAFVGGGQANVVSGAVAQIGFGDVTTNFNGTLTGAGALLKAGNGTLTWNGNANISIANVLVDAGTLALDGNASVNPSLLAVSNSTLTVNGNATATLGALLVSNGTVVINSGTVQVTSGGSPLLQVLNGGNVALNGGLLASSGTVYSNAQDFVVGNGSSVATFQALTGTHTFQDNVVVTNNGILSGAGTLVVNSGAGQVVIKSGGLVSPGNGTGPGTLSESGTMVWNGNGKYLFDVNNFTGTAGSDPGWDLLQINGVLSLAATSGNPFVLDVNSLTLADAPGAPANFVNDNSYQLTIATASGGIANFSSSAVSLVLTNFQTPYDGTWSLQLSGNSLVLNYQGATNYVWQSVSGNFSSAANWIVNTTPPTSTTNVVMYFGGTGAQQYTANNDLTGLDTKRIVLTNSSAKVQTITGNGITLVGLAPEILQDGNGGFVIANNLVLGTNTLVNGTGTGTVELDGQISGAYSLTKTGTYALVLGGANTFSGTTIIQQGQVLAANANALSGSVVSNLVNGGLGFSNLTAATIGGLAGAGNIALANTAGAAVGLTIGGAGTYNGSLTGSGSLTKSVGSTLEVLTGDNPYTGNTTVNGGTLQVSGSIGSTNLSVNGGAVFNWASPTVMTNLSTVTINGGGVFNLQSDGTLAVVTGGGGNLNLGGNTLQVGFGGASSNYAGTINGAGTLSKIGTGTFTINGGGNDTVGALAANNGWLIITNVTMSVTGNGANSAITVNNGGTFEFDAGTVTANNLIVSTGGNLLFNSGTLIVAGASISNGQDFVVGNGVNAALFNVLSGGTATLQNNLIVTNNSTLKGNGTIVVAGGAGNVIIAAGGVLSPGASPGTLTIVGTNIWEGGGSYQFEVNNFSGTQGADPGWDWLNVSGPLSNAATAVNPFVISVTSLTAGDAAGLANFNSSTNYSLVIATASALENFNMNDIVLSLANFQNSYDGVFKLSLQGGTNLVLSYTGLAGFTWKDANGNFSAGGSWEAGGAPPVGTTNVTLYFGGATASPYYANNDLTGLLTKLVTFSNNTTTVQTLTGNSFTFVGLAPELDQDGSGAFVISNNVVLGSTTLAAGTGTGSVTFDGTISGTGGLNKTGSWTLVLGGTNTYSGVTAVLAGKLLVANTYALNGTTLSNLVAGAVVFTNITTARLGGLAGNVDLGLSNAAGAAVSLLVGANNQDSVYSGVLNGGGSLTKIGAGTQTLLGTNTYAGGTVANAGTLVAGSLANGIGAGGSSLGAGTITIAGGTLRFGVGSLLRVTNSVNGSVILDGGTLNAAEFVNQGEVASIGNATTITSDLLNFGSLDVTGGLAAANNIINSGLITNSNGATLEAGGGGGVLSNLSGGSLVLQGGNVVAALVTNNGTVSGYGTLVASVYNNTLVLATNGTLQLAGAALGTGTYQAGGGATLTFSGGGTISTLVNTGGTVAVASLLNNTGVFHNAGTLAVAGGTYQTALVLTNDATGTIRGFGTINSALALVNQGTIIATANSPLVLNPNLINNNYLLLNGNLQVTGVFTNNGTLQSVTGNGTYSSSVVNNGAWITAPGAQSLFLGNLAVTTNGYINADNASVFVFEGNLINQSTNSLAWNALHTAPGTNTTGTGAQFIFSGSSVNQTQLFETTGLQLTGGFIGTPTPLSNGVQNVSSYADVTGFDNNFAVGQLWLTNTTLEVAQAVPGSTTGALFVNDLDLFGNAQLVISNNMDVYFVNSNDWSLANITLLGNAEIHQLNGLVGGMSVIPEPNVLLMWLCGAVTVWAARRRRLAS